MIKPPTIILAHTPGHYGLAGWDDLNRWLMVQNALVHATSKMAEVHGCTEVDRLKLIISALVQQNHHLASLVEERATHGIGMFPCAQDRPSPAFLKFLDDLHLDIYGRVRVGHSSGGAS